MRRLFRAGLVAASAQILAVAVATVAVTIALRRGLVIPASGAAESELQSAVRLLRWIDLFLAVGMALTRNRFIDETAERIREAARRFYPPAPDRACKALFIQLSAASAGLAVLALPSGNRGGAEDAALRGSDAGRHGARRSCIESGRNDARRH